MPVNDAPIPAGRELLLLVDYRDFFYMTVRNQGTGMDLDALKRYFREAGWRLAIKHYFELDLRREHYRGQLILYQSSEDRNLFYKSYLEDVLLALQLQGAILVPEFHLFRAHHNKLFMELLRDVSGLDAIKNIRSRGYGTYEEFARSQYEWPSQVVIKPSEGYASKGVRLLKDGPARDRYIRKVSRSFHLLDAAKDVFRACVRRSYRRESNHRRKFVVQSYVANLANDYKILVFADRYYVLFRRNRRNDFRASGSGLFEYREDVPAGLLDFAERVFQSFAAPYASLDIGFNEHEYFLFEFQFVHMGTFTLENSPFYFVKEGAEWRRVTGRSVLEEEVARSVVSYCETYGRRGVGNGAV